MYGSTPICPRCSKAVYAAEQAMGPGRRFYHKRCLSCALCHRTLTSNTLLEHDLEPYCKPCHVKNFGTRDLRQANHPQSALLTPRSSPSSQRTMSPPPRQSLDDQERMNSSPPPAPVFSREGPNAFPRTVPLSPTKTDRDIINEHSPVRKANTGDPVSPTKPLIPMATGTRYGNVLGTLPELNGSPSPKKFGSVNPACPRCNKSVFFAEQVKAAGRTWHRSCLRCTECGTTLPTGKVNDRDGDPYCQKCYGKLHGPRGGGYALLGKAGG